MADTFQKIRDRISQRLESIHSLHRIAFLISELASVKLLLSKTLERERQLSEEIELLKKDAFKDPLTGLYNLRYLEQVAAPAAMEKAGGTTAANDVSRRKNSLVAVFVDVNGLGRINKKYGDSYGDKLISTVANSLKAEFKRAGDVIARKGGDEMVLLLPSTSVEGLKTAMDKINATTSFEHNGVKFDVKSSYGYSVYTGQSLEKMLEEADKNMRKFKQTAPKTRITEISSIAA